MILRFLTILWVGFLMAACSTKSPTGIADPLPSWNDGPVRSAIRTFVETVTKDGTAGYVRPEDRVAVFDNDGTLWSEQPYYFQLGFILDRIRVLAPAHPEWKDDTLVSAALAGDVKAVFASGEHGLLTLMMKTHAGMSSDEFSRTVKTWIDTARHPLTGHRYRDMVYRPMLELMEYLRANGFKTYIVSGGGMDFMRPWTEEVYGIPPEQVIGSVIGLGYEMQDSTAVLMRLPRVDFIDDKEGKPVGIWRHIGRRPVFAAGNSDGDKAMLQFTTTGSGPRFGLLIHHTDSVREYAYDRQSPIGRLNAALDSATVYRWHVVDMAADWKNVYPE